MPDFELANRFLAFGRFPEAPSTLLGMKQSASNEFSRNTDRRPSATWNYLLWPVLLILVAGNAVKLFNQPLQVDVAWYLYVGKLLLAGKHLYVDIIENNPPLIGVLNESLNWFASTFHLNVKLVWIAFASFAASAPAFLCIYLLDRLGISSGWRKALTGFVIVMVCVIPFGQVFGERDHLAFAALLPVIVLAANRIAKTELSLPIVLLVSLWAGLFLALKPYFLVPWALCWLFTLWQVRWQVLRLPETYIIPALTVLNVLLILLVTPAYFDVVKLASRWYSGYDIQRRFIVMALTVPIWCAFFSIFYRPSLPYNALIRLTSLALLGWILSAILQHKGNDYHLLPATATAALLAFLVLLDLWSREVWRSIFLVPVSAAGLTVFALMGIYAMEEELDLRIEYFDGSRVLLPVLRINEHERVVFLSTALIAFPVVNESGVEFGNAYPCLWTMPGLYAAATRTMPEDSILKFHEFSTMPAAERDLFDRTYSDLSQKPKLIVVDTHKYKWAMGTAIVDFETYFQRDERIRKLWSNYHELPAVPNFRIYQLKSRNSLVSK